MVLGIHHLGIKSPQELKRWDRQHHANAVHEGGEGICVLNKVKHIRLGRQISPRLPQARVCRNIGREELGQNSKVRSLAGMPWLLGIFPL